MKTSNTVVAGWIARLALAAACAMMVSCAGGPRGATGVPAAAVAVPVATPEATPGATPPEAPDTIGRAKLWTGSVRFVGFSEQQLDEFRVIPEQTNHVYRPMNSEYHGVDGFWWKPDRLNWFKIPGHCQVVVWPVAYDGETPRADEDGEEVLAGGSRPRTWLKCQPWLTRILVSQGRVYRAGWYPNAGKSSIGVGYPW